MMNSLLLILREEPALYRPKNLLEKKKKKKAADLTAAELTGELRFKLRLEEEGESVDAST